MKPRRERRYAPGAKWTDLNPVHGERHFEVVRTLDGPEGPSVELIAVLTRRSRIVTREALEQPEQRIAVITADRGLARRVVQHCERWNIAADDSAGRPLALTPAPGIRQIGGPGRATARDSRGAERAWTPSRHRRSLPGPNGRCC
jgi:hypothetical protein